MNSSLRWVPMRYVAEVDPLKSQLSHLPDDLEVAFLPMEDVGTGGTLAPTLTRPLGDVRDGYTYLQDGDVTFAKISPSFQNRKGGRAESLHNGLGFATTELTVLRPNPETDGRYLQYVIGSDPFITAGCATLHGVAGQQRVDSRFVADFKVPLPSLEVQRRVADMLDVETARIDTLIAKNDQVLDLLQVRWQSLLEAAIFGDTSTNRVPLWLTCDVTPGYAFPSGEFQPNGPVRLLRGINVGVGSINWDETVYGEWSTVEPAEEYRLVAGDLVLGMDRPWISSGLRVAKVEASDEPAFLVQRVARLRPHAGLDRDYLYQVLQSRRFFAAFEPSMTGVSVPHVSGGQIGNFRIPLPSLADQERLVGELDQADRRARQLRDQVEHQQGLLRLRRQALITAAVTGQIDV